MSADYARGLYNRRGRRNTNYVLSKEQELYLMYDRILTELAMNRYRWSGLPEGWDERFMIKTLHENGLLVVFRDVGTKKKPGTDKLFALRGAPSGRLDIQDNPVSFSIHGNAGAHSFAGLQLAARVATPIWANYLRVPDTDVIDIYAAKLAKIDTTIDINLNSARRTKVLVYDENTRLSVENINRQINAGEATIPVKFDLGSIIQALDLGVDPKSIEVLSVVRSRFWSEAMGLLGIDNANQDKKERLVEAEVGANEDQVDNMRFVSLNAMQQACLKLQKKYPAELGNIWVEYRSDHMERQRAQFEKQLGIENVEGV